MRPCQLLALSAAALAATWSCDSSPTQPEPSTPPTVCTYQLTSSSSSVGFDGGTVTITVSTGSGCAWSARSEAAWLTIQSGASGTGSGTIALAAAANADAAQREASVSVADQSVKLTQQGRTPCDFVVSPGDVRMDSGGGTGTVTITAPSHCAWTASSDAWISLSPTTGTGNATVSYSVAAWTGTSERSGEIRVEGQRVMIRQSRDPRTCAYSVTPLAFTVHWHGQTGEVRVATDADCPWTVRSTAGWLQMSGAEDRTGDGTVRFVIAEYPTDDTRAARLELRWPTPTAGQNVWVTQEGCRYGAYPASIAVGAAGGSQYVNVLTQPISSSCSLGCSWTAVSEVSWIRIASGSPGSGDDRFRIEISPNTGAARTGRVRVGGQTITVTQARP